jgi:hypothetical protein
MYFLKASRSAKALSRQVPRCGAAAIKSRAQGADGGGRILKV